jgi:hypothetical protein
MVTPVDEPEDEQPAKTLDADDIRFLKTYGLGPYAAAINQTATDIKDIQKRVVETIGIKESDTGLAPPSRWDLVADKQMLYEEQPLQVRASCSLLNDAVCLFLVMTAIWISTYVIGVLSFHTLVYAALNVPLRARLNCSFASNVDRFLYIKRTYQLPTASCIYQLHRVTTNSSLLFWTVCSDHSHDVS